MKFPLRDVPSTTMVLCLSLRPSASCTALFPSVALYPLWPSTPSMALCFLYDPLSRL
jgi:hypothetical protein